MGMLWLLWQRELQVLPRRPGHWRRRVAPVALGGLVLLGAAVFAGRAGGTTMGATLLRTVATLLVLVVSVFAAPTAALTLWHEREQRTLEVLRLSDVSFGVVLLGRWSLTFGLALLSVLACLPLVGLCLSLGGLHWRQGLLTCLVVVSTLFLAVALGLLAGALAGSRRHLLGGLVIGQVLLFLLPWVWWGDDPVWSGRLTALGAVRLLITAAGDLGPVWCYQSLCLGLGSVLLAVAAWALPWRLRRPGSWWPGFLRTRVRRRLGARPLGAEDPVVWFMFVHQYGGWRGVWRRFAVETGLLAVAIAGGVVSAVMQRGHQAEIYLTGLWTLAGAWLAIFFFGTLSGCGQAFGRLWADRGDEVLLLTDLRESYYLWGVWRGIVTAFLPELYLGFGGLLAGAVATTWVAADVVGAVAMVFALVALALGAIYVYTLWRFCCMCALWYSLGGGGWGGLVAPAAAAIYALLVLAVTSATMCCAVVVAPLTAWLHLRLATAVLNRLGARFDVLVRRRLDRTR